MRETTLKNGNKQTEFENIKIDSLPCQLGKWKDDQLPSPFECTKCL